MAELSSQELKEEDLTDEKLLGDFKRFAAVGTAYIKPYLESAVRHYKIYFSVKDEIPEENEEEKDLPNIFLPYAFGIIENIIAKVAQAVLNQNPAVRAQPRHAEDEDRAKNFEGAMRKINNDPQYQREYILSEREKYITGWKWSKDLWMMNYVMGKRWVKRKKTDVKTLALRAVKKIIPINFEVETEEYVEEPYQYPERIGFWTTFPTIFDVIPEPGVRDVRDMHYLIEQERGVALEDLEKQFYEDAEGNKVPVFDLAKLKEHYKDTADGKIIPEMPDELSCTQLEDELYAAITRNSLSNDQDFKYGPRGDINRVHLAHVWKKNLWFCVAQGKFIVAKRVMPFHNPNIPYRMSGWTYRKHSSIPMGAIEPIEHLLYWFNDTQSLTMQQWITATRGMLAVRDDSIVSEDDFRPRAGGRIRIRSTSRVSDAIFPVPYTDSTGSMLEHQSNIRGLIEWTSGVSDLSPGSAGTKQTHKTATGLLEIQEAVEERFSVARSQALTDLQDQYKTALDFMEQFQFSSTSTMVFDENGKPGFKEVTREQIITPRGFDFFMENDPNYGNETLRRDRAVFVYRLYLEYEQSRLQLQKVDWPEANVPEALKKVTQALGFRDTTNLLLPPKNTLAPEKKFELLVRGINVPPKVDEDLTGTLMYFAAAMNSADFRTAVEMGRISPEAQLALSTHYQNTQQLLQAILADPVGVARAKVAQEETAKASMGLVSGDQVQEESQQGAQT